MKLTIEPGKISQKTKLFNLYKKVAGVPDGIIRKENEIDEKYISDFLNASIENGLILTGHIEKKIVGEIHAYTPEIFAFQHILTDLTIVVDPDYHGQGIGKRLFEEFLKRVSENYDHILRVELYVREHNNRNVKFYKRLGFKNEGRQKFKILNAGKKLETPLHMAWFNPNYEKNTPDKKHHV
jgi:ribosomal protein S18 acetylase RimI-like enzyme